MSDRSPAIVAAFPPVSPTDPHLPGTPSPEVSQTKVVDEVKNNLIRRRVNSAHTPSSTTTNNGLQKCKRVHSAIEKRQMISLSANGTPYSSKAWGKTSYSIDYAKRKPIPLPKVRPASATRMHNPHPSQVIYITVY